MTVLYALEKIRTPLLNVIMQLVTYLGQENLFIIAAIGLFWCVDKRRGYYVMTVGFAGLAANQVLKLAFRIPRPWVRNPDFTIVESARANATGYSFPSGHTQSASVVFGTTARMTDRRWLRYVCAAAMLLVAFSRMYLGVHTPLDVSVSLIIGVGLSLALYPYFADPGKSVLPMILATLTIIVAFVLTLELFPFEAVDAVHLEDTKINVYKMLGCVAGIAITCPLDERYIKFDTAAPKAVQIVKLAAGFAILAGLRAGLKAPLAAVLPQAVAGAARYFVVVVFSCLAWPLSFKYLCEIYGKCLTSRK